MADQFRNGELAKIDAVDSAYNYAVALGLAYSVGDDVIQRILVAAFSEREGRRHDRRAPFTDEELQEALRTASGQRSNGHDSQAESAIKAAVFECRPATEIARREWLFGNHYIRGFCSATLGRPGLGKTALAHVESVAMCSAAPIFGHGLEQPLSVWYIGEDPPDEIERRLVAVCQHYRITRQDLGQRLHANSTLEMPPLKFAEQKGKGLIVNEDVFKQMAAEIERRKIDALILDPLIKFHGVPESDNSAMEVVMRTLSELASRTRVSIDALHHIRKQPPGVAGPATVDDGRGASAIIGAIRAARLLNPMLTAEADKAGIAEGDRWRYLRIDRAKSNMAPPEAARWLTHASEILPCGESVGVIKPWKFPDAFDGVTGADVSAIRELARTGAYRSDARAEDWFGKAVAEHLHLDTASKPDCAKIKVLMKTWFKNKVLDVERRHDPNQRKEHDYVVPGPWTNPETGNSDHAQVLD